VTQTEYEAAKDIVLDLLGWGVEPEYLVDLGLSREVVFFAFNELNLRLPSNLNVVGLTPFPPEEVLEAYDRAAGPTTPVMTQASPSFASLATSTLSSNLLPPTPSTSFQDVQSTRPTKLSTSATMSTTTNGSAAPKPGLSSPSTTVSPRTAMPHPSLPPKPPPQAATQPVPGSVPLSVHAPVFVPTAGVTPQPQSQPQPESTPTAPQNGPPPVNLNDIQAQRRKELLARKAAMASLKAKPTVAPIPTPATTGAGVATPLATQAPASSIPAQAVDEFLNSLMAPTPGPIIQPDVLSRMESPEAMDVDDLTPAPANPSLRSPTGLTPRIAPVPPLSRSGSSASVARSQSVASGSSSNERRTGSPPSASSSIARRGTKRPTAVDLIDYDPSLRGRDGSSGSEGPLKGFAAVGMNIRRWVIEFSDDEDEGDVDPDLLPSLVQRRPAPSSPAPLRPHPSRSATPATLVEKEREIERMRQMIAKKEQQNRLKKMSSMARSRVNH
jgi:hypothetical protein